MKNTYILVGLIEFKHKGTSDPVIPPMKEYHIIKNKRIFKSFRRAMEIKGARLSGENEDAIEVFITYIDGLTLEEAQTGAANNTMWE